MSVIRLSYPAIFRQEKNNGWWNVSIPDIYGAVTCGYDLDNAIFMAKDLIRTLFEQSPSQFFDATSLEQTKNNFPNEMVLMIDVDIVIKDDDYFGSPPIRKHRPFFFIYRNVIHEVKGSLIDYRTSKIFILNKDGKRSKEITDNDLKYKLLQIARSDRYEQIFENKKEHIVLYFDIDTIFIDRHKIGDFTFILNKKIAMLESLKNGDAYLCLELYPNAYVLLGDKYDPRGEILKVFSVKVCFNKNDEDFDKGLMKNISAIFSKIEIEFNNI